MSPSVRPAGDLDGDDYERWVAGYDVESGAAKGRLRDDANALRFVEVTVNGPKTRSLAAALHPRVSAVLDAAQGRAAEQIIGWVAAHATTRVGPRGRQVQVQVQVPVEQLEAAVIRHYTSRACDPPGICTCRSTRACSPRTCGAACIPSGRGTTWRRSTGSATPRSRPTPASGGRWPITGSPPTPRVRRARRAGAVHASFQRAGSAARPKPRHARGRVAGGPSGRGAGSAVAAGVGPAGVGAGPPRQGRAHGWGGDGRGLEP